MKSNSILLATLLLGIGLGIGYSIGRWQGNATGETARISTGNQQRTSGKPTAGSDGSTKHKRSSNNAEAPAATAKRLIEGLLRDNLGFSGDPVERVRFQQALFECDEATLSELIEGMRQFASDHRVMESSLAPEAEEWLHLMIQQMAAFDPMKALEAVIPFKTANGRSTTTDLELIFENLARQNPEQIPAALAKMEDSGIKNSGERAWLRTQAKSDPEAVFQYLMARDDKASMDGDDFEAVAICLGSYAPEKALAVIRQYEKVRNLGDLSRQVMASWYQRDPSAAFSHAMAQKDASLLLVFLDDPFQRMDSTAIRNSFTDLKSSPTEIRLELARRLASRLAEKDVPAARQWAATLPPDEQAKANVSIASQWIWKDPVAASEWLATWPAGEDKESAATMLINKIQADDPERALTWATNCLQGQNRYSTLAEIMETFAAKDPNAAAAARAALSEEDRTLLNFTEKHVSRDPFAPAP